LGNIKIKKENTAKIKINPLKPIKSIACIFIKRIKNC